MDKQISIHPIDYIVVALILCISLAIGVLFAVKDFRNGNREEYLLGGRRMLMVPVALSIFATFTSGISLIGTVTEIYMYGSMAGMGPVGMVITYIFAVYSIVPLMYPLRLTSLYTYLELRFDSTGLRLSAVIVGILQTLSYMALSLLSPALALQTAAGIPLWVSVGVVGIIGTVYTAIGGIKSVVWTDAFQSCVMLGGLLTIIIHGNNIIGGGSSVWKIVKDGGRAKFDNFNPDPRDRNTWWGAMVAGSVLWFGAICSQSSLQRISSMKSMKDAKNVFIINAILMPLLGSLLIGLAWTMYAYFVYIRCDPFKAGLVRNSNQIGPYFVMHAMKDLPGISGIYMAMIFSASLSTISSGMNALAANTMEDLLKKRMQNVQESTTTFITKILVFIYGILIIALAYGANSVQGPISQMFATTIGGLGGPVIGIFLLGALCPWGNKYGAICGSAIAIVLNIWIALGNRMYGRHKSPLPYPPTDMCFNSSVVDVFNNHSLALYVVNETEFQSSTNVSDLLAISTGILEQRRFGIFFYDLSFEWLAVIGTFISLVLGMIISHFSQRHCVPLNNEMLLFPFIRKYWTPKSCNLVREKQEQDANDSLMLSNSDVKQDVTPVTYI